MKVMKMQITKASGLKAAWLLLLQCMVLLGWAQQTVSGTIIDAATQQPLDFAGISIHGTSAGTVTDSLGYFALTMPSGFNTLNISIIGYDRQLIKVDGNSKAPLKISMKPSNIELKEVVVKTPKRNKRIVDTTAMYVLARVIEHKQMNNGKAIPQYSLKEHTKLTASLLNAPEKFTSAKIFRPYSFFFSMPDTTAKGEKHIPLGILEEYNETYHFGAATSKDKKLIYYRHLSGFKNPTIGNFLYDQFATIDIYQNIYDIANLSFTSPFSPQGRIQYSYHILDTVYDGDNVLYKLNFVGRNKEDVALKGFAMIDSATWGISSIEFKPNEKANINFLTDYTVQQQYENTGKGWLMQYEKLSAEGNLLEQKGKMAFYVTKVTARNEVEYNNRIPEKLLAAGTDIVVDSAYRRHRRFLDTLRITPLTASEENVYHSFDTAYKVKSFKTLQWLANLVTTGTFRAGPIDFGRVYNVVSRNAVEGYRVRMGVYTNEKMSRIVYLYGHAAYGFSDKKWKYEVDARINIPNRRSRWSQIWVQHKNDMIALGQQPGLLGTDNIFSLIAPRSKYNKVLQNISHNIQYQTDWFKGFSTTFRVSVDNYIASSRGFEFIQQDGTHLRNFHTIEQGVAFRYSPGARYVQRYGIRRFLSTPKPVIGLEYTYGLLKNLGDGKGYHKLQANFEQQIFMPLIGYGKVILSGGAIFGDVAYPLSFISGANLGFYRDDASYQLTAPYEFAHDRFVSLWYEHHFQGLLFNHIPYVSKLKLREFISTKILWGDMDAKNKSVLLLPGEMHTAAKMPYVEVGFGIENILKIAQVSFVWRATYRDTPSAPNFAVKLAIKPSL